MSVLDDMLDSIIAKSGINFYREEIESEFPADDIMIDINDAVHYFWNSLPGDARIAIFGLGRDLPFLVNNVDLAAKNVVCMIDNNPKFNEFAGYPVIRSEDIPNYGIDIVIITSSLYHDEMKAEIDTVAPDCKTAFMWDGTIINRFIIEDALFSFHPREIFYPIYLLNKLILLNNTKSDYRLTLCIIGILLEFRDLKNALVYIDDYLNSGYPDTQKILDLKADLLELLNTIKQALARKQSRHVLCIIADCMAAIDISLDLTPFLHTLGQENIYCPNAHSHMGWTSTSILSMIKQKGFFDNRLFMNVSITGKEPVFERLSEIDGEFIYISHFAKNLTVDSPTVFEQNKNGCASIIWRYLCRAFKSDKYSLCFLHFSEIHEPNICLCYSDLYNPYAQQNKYRDCVKYVDSQTGFLFGLLPNSTSLLFCSDHSRYRGFTLLDKSERYGYDNGGHHIPYVICDRITHTGTDERIVSHLDTMDVLLNMLRGEGAFANIKDRKLAEFNQEFPYSESFLNAITSLMPYRACKCFITDKDKYIIFYDGEERYHLLSDDSVNLIGDAGHADRVNWFRQNVNTEFPDWNDDNGRYDVSRKYYDIGNT